MRLKVFYEICNFIDCVWDVIDCFDGIIDWLNNVDLTSIWNQLRGILNKMGRGILYTNIVLELDISLNVQRAELWSVDTEPEVLSEFQAATQLYLLICAQLWFVREAEHIRAKYIIELNKIRNGSVISFKDR